VLILATKLHSTGVRRVVSVLAAILVQLDQNPFEVAFNIIYGFQQNQISTTTTPAKKSCLRQGNKQTTNIDKAYRKIIVKTQCVVDS